MTDIAERVAKGAEWLDEQRPGWWRDIDLGQLNMADSCLCVLGQVFGEAGEDVVDEDGFEHDMTGFYYAQSELYAPTVDGGFYVRTDWNSASGVRDARERYAELGTAWKQLIAERRAAS